MRIVLLVVVSAFAISLFSPLASARAQNAERALVTFTFGEGVPSDYADTTREGVRFAQDFLISTFGTDVTQPVTVTVKFDDTGTFLSTVQDANVSLNSWHHRGEPVIQRIRGIVHEYAHAWQGNRAGMNVGNPKNDFGPTWLLEGSAVYVSYLAIATGGLATWEQTHDYLVQIANGLRNGQPASLPALSELTSYATMFGEGNGCCSYALGALAVEKLVERAGIQSVRVYYEQLGEQSRWESAFELAFGLSLNEFYREFENERATLLTAQQLDVASLNHTPPFNQEPAEIGELLVPTPVERGSQATIWSMTAPGAFCTLRIIGTDNKEQERSAYANAYGKIFWLFSIRTSQRSGSARAEASCGSNSATAEFALI